jgi:hypothetical protein
VGLARSRRFAVFSNMSGKDAVEVARKLERLTEVLATTNPALVAISPRTIEVFAFAGGQSFLPDQRTGAEDVAGYFLSGDDLNRIAYNARASVPGRDVLDHEFIHAYLDRNIARLPKGSRCTTPRSEGRKSRSRAGALRGAPVVAHPREHATLHPQLDHPHTRASTSLRAIEPIDAQRFDEAARRWPRCSSARSGRTCARTSRASSRRWSPRSAGDDRAAAERRLIRRASVRETGPALHVNRELLGRASTVCIPDPVDIPESRWNPARG